MQTYGLGITFKVAQSDSIVNTDSSGKGTQSITAQVEIPPSLPLFGSIELRNYPINVKISDNCLDYSLTFITIMAHELSHILLRSVWHKEKDNEFYTDLTAMILGFYDIFQKGRKIENRTHDNSGSDTIYTTTYGYLSDVQFEYAYTKIRTMLLKSRNAKDYLISEITQYHSLLSLVQPNIDEFNTLLKSYDLKQSQTFSKEDSDMIVLFHQPDFLYDYESTIKSGEKFVEEIRAFCEGCNHYIGESKNKIQQYRDELNRRSITLNNNKLLLESYVTRLKKCTTLFYRLNLDLHKKLSGKTKS